LDLHDWLRWRIYRGISHVASLDSDCLVILGFVRSGEDVDPISNLIIIEAKHASNRHELIPIGKILTTFPLGHIRRRQPTPCRKAHPC